MQKTKNKTIATLITLILTISMVFPLFALPATNAGRSRGDTIPLSVVRLTP